MVTVDSLLTQFARASEDCRRLTGPLNASLINWKPAPKSWSVGQCIEHLTTAGELVADNLEAAVDGRSSRWLAPLLRPLERAFVASMKPGTSLKVTSPGIYRPSSSDVDPEEMVVRFQRLQTRLTSTLSDYALRGNLNRIVRSPATGLLWMSAKAWFEVTAAHQERHLDQARRVLAHPHFPASD